MKHLNKPSFLEKLLQNLTERLKFYVATKTIRNYVKNGGYSNLADGIDSDNEDEILADLKQKCKTVEGYIRITKR